MHNIYVEKLKMFPCWKSLSMNWRFLIISQEDNEIDEMLRSQEDPPSLNNIKLVSTANLNKEMIYFPVIQQNICAYIKNLIHWVVQGLSSK